MPSSFTIRPILTDADWAAARVIRTRVFIEEQACPPEEEWDHYDRPEARGVTAHHLLALDGDAPVGTARWHPTPDGAAKLERFAVLARARGRGLGRALVARTLADARAAGHARFMLHAQAHLEAFYASLGFARVGEGFEEAGIPHVKMVKH